MCVCVCVCVSEYVNESARSHVCNSSYTFHLFWNCSESEGEKTNKKNPLLTVFVKKSISDRSLQVEINASEL